MLFFTLTERDEDGCHFFAQTELCDKSGYQTRGRHEKATQR
jgi:hypothetical protein